MIRRRRKPRRGPLRDQAYKNWLKERKCVACSAIGSPVMEFSFPGFKLIDPAHTQNNGMGSKGPDSSCAPLCRIHHREYDKGRKAFEVKYGVDMANETAAHYAAFLIAEEEA